MRTFVDVGAHYGETLDVALDPKWAFDRVYSLEPSRDCQSLLRSFRDHRIQLDDRGLSNETRTTVLHGSGLLGGSVYDDKPQGIGGAEETVRLVRASEWLREHTNRDDQIWLKLNCEGSEVDILDDLLGAPETSARIQSVYVDFDVRKIPSQAHRQAEVEARLRDQGMAYVTPDLLGAAGNRGVARWLQGTIQPVRPSTGRRLHHALRLYLPPYLWLKMAARAVLPRTTFLWLGSRLGVAGRR